MLCVIVLFCRFNFIMVILLVHWLILEMLLLIQVGSDA